MFSPFPLPPMRLQPRNIHPDTHLQFCLPITSLSARAPPIAPQKKKRYAGVGVGASASASAGIIVATAAAARCQLLIPGALAILYLSIPCRENMHTTIYTMDI